MESIFRSFFQPWDGMGFFPGENVTQKKHENLTRDKEGMILMEKFCWEIRMFDQQKKVARRRSQDVLELNFWLSQKNERNDPISLSFVAKGLFKPTN